ncbi:TauD/TfdA family dioxygenase [Roseiarcaceae bacterium H3SJ34-1]|uniref:TauD/TfdA dioxygenase family protein n=1 Tax=Terripilifer ovatus TaxID=3032367 RepID=UPI003AB97165|nr:TauD/TfdA family dioxygenase [Roseiarcaceae bacterium H3SJ34-1]
MYHHIKVEPVSPVIGAEISGVDLTAPLDDKVIAEIRQALLDHLVVFFRDQAIGFDHHTAFARRFGELHVHPGAALRGNNAELVRIYADEKSKVVAGERWHSDLTCDPLPPMGSILHMHVLPSCGGDTQFTSAYAAYDALSDRMKAYLEGLTAHHDGTRVFSTAYAGKENADKVSYPKADHPVVVRHPETGRKLLFVNPEYTIRINELGEAEGEAVLKFLYSQIGLPQYSTRFRWRPNSIAFWDNRSAMHIAVWDYFPQTRLGYRATIKRTAPPTA